MKRKNAFSFLSTNLVTSSSKTEIFKNKVGYILVLAARRMKQYCQDHTMHVMTDLPLKRYQRSLDRFVCMLN